MNRHHNRILRRAKALKALGWIAGIAFILAWTSVPREAHAADSTDTAAMSAAADGVSTVIAVGSGVAKEVGTITSAPIFAVVAVTKVAVPYAVKGLPPEQRKPILQVSAGMFGGAAANNLTIFVLAKAGVAAVGSLAALPVAIGVGVGYYLYTSTGRKFDEEQKALTAPEADARLAMNN